MDYPTLMNKLTRRILRILFLALLGTLLLTALVMAFAQEGMDWQYTFAQVLGSDLDAVIVDCTDIFGPGADGFDCLETGVEPNLAKLRVDSVMLGYPDVRSISPWQRLDNDGLSRLYTVDDEGGTSRGYTVGILPDDFDQYNSFVLVEYHGHYDQQGNEIEQQH